jgi:hypothetical protein
LSAVDRFRRVRMGLVLWRGFVIAYPFASHFPRVDPALTKVRMVQQGPLTTRLSRSKVSRRRASGPDANDLAVRDVPR